MPNAQILIIDDEVVVGTFFRRLLKMKGYDVSVAVNGAEAARLIQETAFNVAMVDLKLPDTSGLSLLRMIKEMQPSCEAIMMTGYSTTKTAVRAIQLGAFDYLEKPFEDIDEVENLIHKAVEYGRRGYDSLSVEADWAVIAEQIGFYVGNSPNMQKMLAIAYKVAKKNISVLIHGETGTGKELLARFIHAASTRSDQNFIPVNCGALTESLLGSELFGHEKGAFTGAVNMRRGIFELANRGTLFLDEILEASHSIQVKLLRVLETYEFLRIGGEKLIKTNIRVISATNASIDQALKDKTFREDLFYRLNVVWLEVPPLRNRREDIPSLVEYFVRKINPELRISEGAMHLLCNYSWPGNIRELINIIKQLVALCEGKFVLPEHLDRIINLPSHKRPVVSHKLSLTLSDQPDLQLLEKLLEQYCSENMLDKIEESRWVNIMGLLSRLENNLAGYMKKKGIDVAQPSTLDEIEAKAIRDTLSFCQGNITMTSEALGIGRNTLYRKMKSYNIKF